MTPEVFERAMTALLDCYDKELSPAGLELYWRCLNHLDDNAFEAACFEAAQRERFFPKPVVLLEIANGSQADKGIGALSLVEQSFQKIGAYRSVQFEDKAITATIRLLGGWPAVCALDRDEWDRFRSKEFLRIYGSLSRREVSADMAEHLPGIIEKTNKLQGHDGPEPVLVCSNVDKEQRRAIDAVSRESIET